MPTIADVMGWTQNRADISRLEERAGWLGRSRVEPEPPAWWGQRDPTDQEETEAER
jgi:hypothetical protein